MKKNKITIEVGLGEDQIPETIHWTATQKENASEAKAFLLSIFEKDSLDTLKIDLWTKEMQVTEMDRFFYQTLRALADTYYKSTNNKNLAGDMQRFVQYFAEETGIIPKSTPDH